MTNSLTLTKIPTTAPCRYSIPMTVDQTLAQFPISTQVWEMEQARQSMDYLKLNPSTTQMTFCSQDQAMICPPQQHNIAAVSSVVMGPSSSAAFYSENGELLPHVQLESIVETIFSIN